MKLSSLLLSGGQVSRIPSEIWDNTSKCDSDIRMKTFFRNSYSRPGRAGNQRSHTSGTIVREVFEVFSSDEKRKHRRDSLQRPEIRETQSLGSISQVNLFQIKRSENCLLKVSQIECLIICSGTVILGSNWKTTRLFPLFDKPLLG